MLRQQEMGQADTERTVHSYGQLGTAGVKVLRQDETEEPKMESPGASLRPGFKSSRGLT